MRNNGTQGGDAGRAGDGKPAPVAPPRPTTAGAIEITATGHVLVRQLLIDRRPVAEYLQRAEPPEWPRLLIEAIEIGVGCLERASQVNGLDFVRQQVQFLAAEIGKIPAGVEQELRKQIGVKDGQVLAPVVGAVAATEKVLKEKIAAVQTLLDKEIDPRRVDTTLGRTLNTIAAMLDGKREDSVQRVLDGAVRSVAAEDGRLAAVVKQTLIDSLKPVREEIDRLRKEVQRQEAAEDALARTPTKGVTFEKTLLGPIRCWGRFGGAAVEHVGGDHQPGDYVVTLSDSSLGVDEFTIVVEAKDDAMARGRKRIADEIGRAMKTRGAHFGVYVGKTEAAFAKEIGDWGEGRCSQGAYVACTAANLLTALRFAVVDSRLRVLQSLRPGADLPAIQHELRRVRTALRRVRTIRGKSSDIQKGADAIEQEAGELYREIGDALAAIETALRGTATAVA